MNNIVKLFICLLLLCYIIFLFNIYIFYKNECKQREDFIGILQIISDTVGGKYDSRPKIYSSSKTIGNDIENDIKKEDRYIYIKNNLNNPTKYMFYNKKNKNYANLNININHDKLVIYNISNTKIGELTKHIYNDYFIKSDIFSNKEINVNFMNYYKDVKINIEGDDKYFFIKKYNENIKTNTNTNNNTNNENILYNIYLYGLKIGKIKNLKKIDDNNIYKIIIYEEYKKYLNIFGVVFTMLLDIKLSE